MMQLTKLFHKNETHKNVPQNETHKNSPQKETQKIFYKMIHKMRLPKLFHKMRLTEIIHKIRSTKFFNVQLLKYYHILEKFRQMTVPDMARPRDAHASKNCCVNLCTCVI